MIYNKEYDGLSVNFSFFLFFWVMLEKSKLQACVSVYSSILNRYSLSAIKLKYKVQ